jgi:hypothetical protein
MFRFPGHVSTFCTKLYITLQSISLSVTGMITSYMPQIMIPCSYVARINIFYIAVVGVVLMICPTNISFSFV